jgi:hypothetical protein
MFRDIYWLFLVLTRRDPMAEPSNCHHPTSNQIESVYLFLSLITLLSLAPPQPTATGGGGTQDVPLITITFMAVYTAFASRMWANPPTGFVGKPAHTQERWLPNAEKCVQNLILP